METKSLRNENISEMNLGKISCILQQENMAIMDIKWMIINGQIEIYLK